MATAVNRSWASELGADGQPVYAPRYAITVNGRKIYNPKDKHYRLAGFLPVVEVPPSEPPAEGYHWEPRGWEAQENAIRRVYVEVANPPPAPRRWSSLAIKRVLEARGSWAEVKRMLEAAGVYDDFLMADYIAEDDQAFLSARAEAVKLYGEETVAAILDAIPQEG